ncbi:MAG: glycosyltransferase [Proteobacteria bacterium]|nr:glycosyltransferase [Pseudomonadota bacterium]
MIDIIIVELIGIGDYIFAQGFWQLFALFWPLLILDLPRYVCTDLTVLIMIWFMKNEDKATAKKKLLAIPPLASVIVPAFNEENAILKSIKSLQEQTYPNLEIIVVDDGSTDRTYELCIPLARQNKIKLLRNRVRGGKPSAINYALNFCQGEYVVIVDSDSSFDRDAILNLLVCFANENIGVVSGNIRVRNAKLNLLTGLQALEYQISIAVERRFTDITNILSIVSGAFGAFRKDLLSEIGGMDGGPGEDLDSTIKVRKKLIKVAFASDAICMTDVPSTLHGYIKQRLRWERDLVKLTIRKHKNVFNPLWNNFSFYNLLSMLDIIFFHVMLGLTFFIYIVYLFIYFREIMFIILLVTYIYYIAADTIQTFIAWWLSERKREDLHLFFYIPIFSLYNGYFERMIRVVAYLDEFLFRRSYKDLYIPRRVGAKMIKW